MPWTDHDSGSSAPASLSVQVSDLLIISIFLEPAHFCNSLWNSSPSQSSFRWLVGGIHQLPFNIFNSLTLIGFYLAKFIHNLSDILMSAILSQSKRQLFLCLWQLLQFDFWIKTSPTETGIWCHWVWLLDVWCYISCKGTKTASTFIFWTKLDVQSLQWLHSISSWHIFPILWCHCPHARAYPKDIIPLHEGLNCFLLQPIEGELWCILAPRAEWNMWPTPLGLDSTSFFFVFRFVLGDKCNHKLLLTRWGSSFDIFGVILFAFFFNSFTFFCNVSICFSNFLFYLWSAFFFAEVTGSVFFSFFEILIWYFCFFNLSFSLFILIFWKTLSKRGDWCGNFRSSINIFY